MKKPITLFIASILTFALNGCQTTGSSSQGRQNAITNASMLSSNTSCNQIAHNIGTMDQIIVETGSAGYSSSYDTRQAMNNTLSHSDLSPYISDIASAWKGGGSNNQLERQQNSNAQREKSRLIGLFQQKKCVRSN